jgi:hypothetical protein
MANKVMKRTPHTMRDLYVILLEDFSKKPKEKFDGIYLVYPNVKISLSSVDDEWFIFKDKERFSVDTKELKQNIDKYLKR